MILKFFSNLNYPMNKLLLLLLFQSLFILGSAVQIGLNTNVEITCKISLLVFPKIAEEQGP